MITKELQKAIYEYRERDPYHRFPDYIFMDSKAYCELKADVESWLIYDTLIKTNETSFCGIQIIEDNCVQGFHLWSKK